MCVHYIWLNMVASKCLTIVRRALIDALNTYIDKVNISNLKSIGFFSTFHDFGAVLTIILKFVRPLLCVYSVLSSERED